MHDAVRILQKQDRDHPFNWSARRSAVFNSVWRDRGSMPTNVVSLLLNISMRKSQRIELSRGTPSSGPIGTSVASPRNSLYTGAQITVDSSSFAATKSRETTT